ncbi:hypothetical protein KEM55_000524 [Ascosphaera atra]|nr:hypothetical protein KEM55_000524 [Ascosphaera atra]
MSVWLELGCMIPRSGGTKVYLEAAFPRPKLLTTAVFGVQATLLCFTVSGLIVFATNILKAAGADESPEWLERGIAIGTGVAVIGTHIIFPKAGVQLMNAAGALKVSILTFVVLTGWVVMGGGVSRVKHPNESFKHAFHGSATSVSVYSTALFKAIGSLSGWANATWVLNEIQDPVKTLKRAGPIALSTCGVLYMFANLSYFAALTPHEVANSGTNLAANFAEKVFGEAGARALRYDALYTVPESI